MYPALQTRFRSNFKQLMMDKHATRTFTKNIKGDLVTIRTYNYRDRFEIYLQATSTVKF